MTPDHCTVLFFRSTLGLCYSTSCCSCFPRASAPFQQKYAATEPSPHPSPAFKGNFFPWLSVCLSVYLSIYLSIYPVYLPDQLSVLSVFPNILELTGWEKQDGQSPTQIHAARPSPSKRKALRWHGPARSVNTYCLWTEQQNLELGKGNPPLNERGAFVWTC